MSRPSWEVIEGDCVEAMAAMEACFIDERDHWKRMFNRLEAAISHHKKHTDKLFADTHDEALYKARDSILRDAADGV